MSPNLMRGSARNLTLSAREEQILLLASHGMTDRQISAELGIRAGTINTHWSRIRLKLGAATRSEAVSILLKDKANAAQRALEAEKESLEKQIQQQRQLQQEMSDSRTLLHGIVSNLPMLLWSVGAGGEVLAVEGKLVTALGLKPTSGIRQRSTLIERLVPADAAETAWAGTEVRRAAEIEGIHLDYILAPVQDSRAGRVAGLVGIAIAAPGN